MLFKFLSCCQDLLTIVCILDGGHFLEMKVKSTPRILAQSSKRCVILRQPVLYHLGGSNNHTTTDFVHSMHHSIVNETANLLPFEISC